MTKQLAILAACAILTCSSRAQGPGGSGRGGMMRTPAFTTLDSDGDGIISAAEIQKAPEALKSLDKNSDGRLTEDEVRPAFGPGGRGFAGGREGGPGRDGASGREGLVRPGGRGGRGDEPGETAPPSADDIVQTLMAFDRNGDGKLTRDEVPERMQGLFDRADADKNGILTPEEIRNSARAQTAPGGNNGRDEREAGGRRDGGREGMSFMRLDPILAALDTDSDGVISADELRNASASLRKLDKNQDGKLTEDEVRVNAGRGRGPGQDRN